MHSLVHLRRGRFPVVCYIARHTSPHVVYTACSAPLCLSTQLTRIADIPSRRRLRSSATDALLVCPTRLVTVGDRAFLVAAAKLWNELPSLWRLSVVSLTLFCFVYHIRFYKICTARHLCNCSLYINIININIITYVVKCTRKTIIIEIQ